MEHEFKNHAYTLGIEEELMILDAESLELVNAIETLLEPAPSGEIKPELMESVLEVSTVVWCTGSEPDHSFLPGEAFDAHGRPVHERGVSPVDGLYFLGLEFQYAIASGTIQGLDRDARHLLKHMQSSGKRRRRLAAAAPAA